MIFPHLRSGLVLFAILSLASSPSHTANFNYQRRKSSREGSWNSGTCQVTPKNDTTVPRVVVAHVYPADASDFGWSLAAITGQNEVKNKLRDDVNILSLSYDIRINGTATLVQFASFSIAFYKVDVIVGHGNHYFDTIVGLAHFFPHVKFVQIGGWEEGKPPIPPNVNVVQIKQYKGSYMGGYIAGLETKTNQSCYVVGG